MQDDGQGAAPGANAGPVLGPGVAKVLLVLAGLIFACVGILGCAACQDGISKGAHQGASLELLPPGGQGHSLLGKEAVGARALGEALLTLALPWAALAGNLALGAVLGASTAGKARACPRGGLENMVFCILVAGYVGNIPG